MFSNQWQLNMDEGTPITFLLAFLPGLPRVTSQPAARPEARGSFILDSSLLLLYSLLLLPCWSLCFFFGMCTFIVWGKSANLPALVSLLLYSSWNSTLQVFTFFLRVHLLSLHIVLSHGFPDLSFNSVSLSSDASNRFDLWTMNFSDLIFCYFIKFSL